MCICGARTSRRRTVDALSRSQEFTAKLPLLILLDVKWGVPHVMPAPIEPAGPGRPGRTRGARPVTAPVFLATAEDEVTRAWRYDRMLSVALARIDEMARPGGSGPRLKTVDVELAVLGATCSMLRAPDRVALVGAGELAILLPETGARQTHAVMERLREHVAAQQFDIGGVRFGATLSIGAASLTHRVRSARQMLMAARHERRRAQAGGGNCVMSPPPTRPATAQVRDAGLH